jgi:hypothetical protein
VIARFNAGGFGSPPNDAVGVLLEEGIGCNLAGLTAGGSEEIAVDVIGEAGRLDIIVQTPIEAMMTGNVIGLPQYRESGRNPPTAPRPRQETLSGNCGSS